MFSLKLTAVVNIVLIHFAGSLESPLAASPAQAYHPSSTYFHQECQWFFDPPPARQLILKISTAQKMSKSKFTYIPVKGKCSNVPKVQKIFKNSNTLVT